MPSIRASEGLIELLKDIRKLHAKRTGEFVSFEEIIETSLDDFDDERLDDDWEEDDEN